MYFRLKKTKTTPVLQLVESYRDKEGKPRQKILLSLGDIDIAPSLWKTLAVEVENHLLGTPSLFEMDPNVRKWVDLIVRELERRESSPSAYISIDPKKITHECSTELGPELVVQKAWDTLGLTPILHSCGFNPTQIDRAFISIVNRLISPVRTTSIPDLLNRKLQISKDTFYRTSDVLLKYKEEIETALATKEQELFSLKRTILLYDMTNTFFEGESLKNPKSRRGASKEKRFDAPLLACGMVLDEEGFLIRHEVFPGNTADCTTLEGMLDKLHSNMDKPPTVIIDSGFATKANLKMLKEKNFDYITVGKRPSRKSYNEEIKSLSFSTITGRDNKEPVEIAMQDIDDERIVFCKSHKRGLKEEAILSRAEDRFLADLTKLKTSLEAGRLKKKEVVERKIGRLQERHHRVSRYYELSLAEGTLNYKRLEEEFELAKSFHGYYHLRSSRKDLSAEEIWKIYIMLTRVESGFRTLKSTLGLRPIFHQREDRSDGHIFITVLAYHLLRWIEQMLSLSDQNISWLTARRILQTHCYTTIVCPLENGKTYRQRTAGTPDNQQKSIYSALKVEWDNLPRYSSTY